MTSAPRRVGRIGIIASGAAAILVLAAAYRTPRPEPPPLRSNQSIVSDAAAPRALDNQGESVAKENIAMVAIESKSRTHVDVIVYATKAARVAAGALTPGMSRDTLRLRTPATVTADLTGGEVHIVSLDGSMVEVTAIFRDSPAIKAQNQSAHVVLKQGGVGVGVSPPDSGTAGQGYFEFQVEKPVVQIPGIGAPEYPGALRAALTEGEVQAQFVVNQEGQPEIGTFKILKATNDLFANAVRAAFPGMRFAAAEIDGRKVRQIVQQSFLFRLDRKKP